MVLSIMAKLPSEYRIQRYLKLSVVPISVTGGPTFDSESYSISAIDLLKELRLNFSMKLS